MSTMVYPYYTITSDPGRHRQVIELTTCPKCRHESLANVVLKNAEDRVWSVCDNCGSQLWVQFALGEDALLS